MALAHEIRTRFWDGDRGAFRHGTADDALPVAPLDMSDGALPSGGALATQLWLELGLLTGDDVLDDAATKLLARRGASFSEAKLGAGAWLTTLEAATADQREVVIAGDDPNLLDVMRDADPGRILFIRIPAGGAPASDHAAWPALVGKKSLGGKSTAFVCERGSCKLPTSDPAVLRKQITRP
jgi:uncharacterized protein